MYHGGCNLDKKFNTVVKKREIVLVCEHMRQEKDERLISHLKIRISTIYGYTVQESYAIRARLNHARL